MALILWPSEPIACTTRCDFSLFVGVDVVERDSPKAYRNRPIIVSHLVHCSELQPDVAQLPAERFYSRRLAVNAAGSTPLLDEAMHQPVAISSNPGLQRTVD